MPLPICPSCCLLQNTGWNLTKLDTWLSHMLRVCESNIIFHSAPCDLWVVKRWWKHGDFAIMCNPLCNLVWFFFFLVFFCLFVFLLLFFSGEIKPDIAQQINHMKCQALFSLKNTKKKKRRKKKNVICCSCGWHLNHCLSIRVYIVCSGLFAWILRINMVFIYQQLLLSRKIKYLCHNMQRGALRLGMLRKNFREWYFEILFFLFFQENCLWRQFAWNVKACFLVITKTRLFKNTENFTNKKMKIFR